MTTPFDAALGWGIPTMTSLREVVADVPNVPVFASGGMRTGIDAANAMRLGASLVGMAAPTLGSALETATAVHDMMTATIEELRIAMFCTGSPDLEALKSAEIRYLPTGESL